MIRVYKIMQRVVSGDEVAAALVNANSPWAGQPLSVSIHEIAPELRSAHIATAGSTSSVKLIGDDAAQTMYLVIAGNEGKEIYGIADAVDQHLPVATFSELYGQARERYHNQPHLLRRMALGSPAFVDSPALDLLIAAARDATVAVRGAAIVALALTQWLQAFEPLEERAASDPDEGLRDLANRSIASLRQALRMEP